MVGILLESQGKRDEARRWYEATVAELPAAPIAANNLAFIYAEQGTNLDVALLYSPVFRYVAPRSSKAGTYLGSISKVFVN